MPLPSVFDRNGSTIPGYVKPNLTNQPKLVAPTGNTSTTKPTGIGAVVGDIFTKPAKQGIPDLVNRATGKTSGAYDPNSLTDYQKSFLTDTTKNYPAPGNNPGMISQSKTVSQLHQDHIDANKNVAVAASKALTDAQKSQKDAQARFDASQASGSPINNGNARTPEQIAAATGQNAPTYNNGNNVPQNNNPNSQSSFPGLISSLANTSTTPNPTQTAAQAGLLATAQPGSDYQDIKNQIAKNLEDQQKLRTNYAESFKNLDTSGIDASLATGQENVMSRTLAAKEGALAQQGAGLASQLSAANQQQGVQQAGFTSAGNLANTQQGNIQSGLSSAAGYAQPVGQFGMLTNPQTGQPLNTGVFQGAVAQAKALVDNDADPAGSAVQSLLTPFGFIGQLAYNQAQGVLSGSGYNPTAQSAQTQQNVAQAAKAQNEAYQLNIGLENLKNIKPLAVDFIGKSGLNSFDSPLYNKPINDYINTLGNTEAGIKAKAIMNDIKKYASQVLAAGAGGIPTDVHDAMSSVDPSTLNATQLQGYLNTLEALGGNQLKVLQDQSSASYGGNGGYSGNTASIASSVPTGAPNTSLGSGITDPTQKVAAGVGLGTASWFKSQVANFGSELLSFLGGMATRGMVK